MASLGPLKDAGFACHWLHPRTKRPIGKYWSEAPVASLDDLRRTHAAGNNVGVRLGEHSVMTAGGYLHTFDIDIRIADLAEEAWSKFAELFPHVRVDSLPMVASGSGGESRHLHIITDKAFYSKKLAVSEGKHRGADGKWHYDWEIELFGTGKQVVLPPSIHPDTGQPYVWLRPLDFDALALGAGPFISSAAIERIAAAVTSTYEFETREPLTFEAGQLERDLNDVPIDHIDDYHDWIMLGQALHHQFGAGDEGFDLWIETSKRSAKFDQNDMRELRRKWHGFGRNRRQPVTMGTVRQWALDARRAQIAASFDEEEDEIDIVVQTRSSAHARAALDGDRHRSPMQPGAAEDWTTSPRPPLPAVDIDALLGLADEPGTADPIDSIGTAELAASRSAKWMELLSYSEKGAILPNLHNVEMIVRHDPRLAGLPQTNEFTGEVVQRQPPGKKAARRRNAAKETRQLDGRLWSVDDRLNGDLWSDDRDFAVRAVLEAPKSQGGYDLKVSDRDLRAAIVLEARRNSFHPVREYLEGLTWDGTPRVEELFVTYLGAADTEYSRSVARLMMVAAVTRIFEPGHKFDFAVILEGLQGKRKSTFIRLLGRSWFAELDGDFHDAKQMIELMQGAWIMEIPELSGFSRGDVRAIKAFISRQQDKARLAYARRAAEFARQVVFIGSTNDREYLKDDTGGRRFWPMPCSVKSIDTDRLEQNVDQLWAEAAVLYREMRAKQPRGQLPLYLDGEASREAQLLQETRRVETEADALAGEIAAWLDRPITTGSLDDDARQPGRRNITCFKEIWVECLRRDSRAYDRSATLAVGAAMRLVDGWEPIGLRDFGALGKQRAYGRGGRMGLLDLCPPL